MNTNTDGILRCGNCRCELVDVDTVEKDGILYCSAACIPSQSVQEMNKSVLVKPTGNSLKIDGWDL